MADLTEVNNFDTTVHELGIEPALGGPGQIMNAQAQALANRTRWLYNRVNKIFFSFLTPGPLVVPLGTVGNVNGNTYAPNTFPLNFPDYTTPNDGVTRVWEISMSFKCAWTETAGQFVGIRLYTVSSAPAYQEIADTIRDKGTGQSTTWKVILSLPPNTRVALSYQNAGTGANATFNNIQLTMKEL